MSFVLNETGSEMARTRELDESTHAMTRVRVHFQVDYPRALRIMEKGKKIRTTVAVLLRHTFAVV